MFSLLRIEPFGSKIFVFSFFLLKIEVKVSKTEGEALFIP